MGVRFSRSSALFVGIMLPAVETWRRWNMLADWSSWLDDYIAGALLLFAWYAGRSHPARSSPYLMAAWGFFLGTAYMAFVVQLKSPFFSDPSGIARPYLLAFKSAGLLLAAAGLACVWKGPRA